MAGSLLITAIALALTSGLLRLRHNLVTCSKEPQLSHRAYVMWFAGTDNPLGPWLTELVGHARHFPRLYGHL